MMKRLTIDFLILLLISTAVIAYVLLMPKDNLRVERNWGSVFYAPPVSAGEATEFADLMVQAGLFAGNPLSFKLQRNDVGWTIMMASNRNYEDSIDRDTMVGLGKELCATAFPGQTVSFVLTDKDLDPIDEIVPTECCVEPEKLARLGTLLVKNRGRQFSHCSVCDWFVNMLLLRHC